MDTDKSSISSVDSLEGMGEFWDSHDFTDFDDFNAPDVNFDIAVVAPALTESAELE